MHADKGIRFVTLPTESLHFKAQTKKGHFMAPCHLKTQEHNDVSEK